MMMFTLASISSSFTQFTPSEEGGAVFCNYSHYTSEKESIGLGPEQIQNHVDHCPDH